MSNLLDGFLAKVSSASPLMSRGKEGSCPSSSLFFPPSLRNG